MNIVSKIAVSLVLVAAGPAVAAPPPAPTRAAEGNVTRAQMEKEVRTVFDMADTNKDGFMSKAEFRARMGKVLNRTPPGTKDAPDKAEAHRMLDAADAAFKAVDTNGDGKLSFAEASKRPMAAFDMMDSNHDGILTVEEKIAARAAAKGTVEGAPAAVPKSAPKGR